MKLYSEGPLSVTGISNCFIDEYMPEANGEYVKVYLYLLRCIGNPELSCSVSAIADHFDHTEKDVLRALKYWERSNVLRLDYDNEKRLTGIAVLPLSPKDDFAREVSAPSVSIVNASGMQAVPMQTAPIPSRDLQPLPAQPFAQAAPVSNAPARRDYSAGEIDSFRKDPEVSELFYIIEAYLGKPLTVSAINTVLYWFEELEFSVDVIDYLVEYCVSKNHKSFRYMDRIALDWHENGIYTIEAAKAETEKHNKINYTVIKALGISGRDLAQSEKAFVQKWSKEWGFDEVLIEEACKRTIESTHQSSFQYTDKVLATWHDRGITTLAGVKQLDEEFSRTHRIGNVSASSGRPARKTAGRNIDERTYDYEELEQQLIKAQVQ